jgi:hypothetical protein
VNFTAYITNFGYPQSRSQTNKLRGRENMKEQKLSIRKSHILLIAVAVGVALLAYLPMRDNLSIAQAEAQELKSVVETTEKELLGYTSYTSFITGGKQSLAGQMKLLTAKIVREEGVTQQVTRGVLPGLSSSGTVAIWYSAEYSFGFDLRPNQYDVRSIPSGIEVRVKKPILITTPAVSNLKYKVLTGGVLTDEKAAALKLYETASVRAKAQGTVMASEAPILALCEKKLIEFLYGFLAKQPGVKVVPHITVTYM